MKQRIVVVLGLVLLGAAFALVVHFARPREVVFHGKPVRAWAFQLYGPIRREEAAAAFQELGARAVPDLVRMVRAKDPVIAKALYPPPAWLPKPLQRLVLRNLRPADASARRTVAAHALAALGPKAAPAVPALARMLTGARADERWLAATALGRIATPAAAQVCLVALRGTNADLHHPAVYALGEMGPAAAPALPLVLRCLGHERPAVRDSAIYTLSQIGALALEPVIRIVREQRGVERRAAAQALLKLSASRRVVVPPLLAMLDDPDALTRAQALDCLLAVAPRHDDVTAVLKQLLDDPDDTVRTAAAQALEKAGGVTNAVWKH